MAGLAYTGSCDLVRGFSGAYALAPGAVGVARFVTLVQWRYAVTPDQRTTSGSQSTPTNFNNRNLAQAAATARDALLALASERLGIARDQLAIGGGAIAAKGDPSKRATYGELVAGKKFNLQLDPRARRKPARDWTVLGTSVPRLAMVVMSPPFEFAHLECRECCTCLVRPPEVGATVVNVDERSVSHLPGVVKVVTRQNFIGVVAEKPWQARQAAAKLQVTWTTGRGLPAQGQLYEFLRKQPSRDSFVVNSKDVDDRLAKAASIVKATYLHPYQMHGSIGTSCAVADVQGAKATVWSPTQSAYPTRSGVAMLLGLAPADVRVIFTRGAGCYGINGADTVSYDAALLSQAVGKPVRVQLSRQDEMAWENYGLPYVIDQRVAVDASGVIVAWDHEAWFASLGGRPGTGTPGNVVTGMLAGFAPAPFAPRTAADPAAVSTTAATPPVVCCGPRRWTAGGAGR